MLVSTLLLLLVDPVEFKPVLTLADVPAEQELYLQNVLHIEIDDKGRFYASDFPSARVFYWNPDGSYAGYFGSKGEGPGEYSFAASLGPPMGYVNVLDDKIYIYDGGSRMVSVLDRSFKFIKRVTFEGLGGKINNFHVLEEDRFLFYDSYFCEKKACRRLLVYDDKGTLLQTWMESPDLTWAADESNGRVNLYIWEPIPVVDFSRSRNQAVVAHSSRPLIELWSPAGEKKRSLTLDIPRKAVTRDDIDEYNDQDWVKGNESVKIIFPDEKDYFDQVLTTNAGYLVYHMSPLYGIADGYLVDWNGKVQGRFTLPCGEGGTLYAPRGRIMAAIVDEEGEFILRELTIEKP